MSEVRDFLEALSKNPEAKKLIREAKEPANVEEAAALYAEIAEKTGVSVTKETIQQILDKKQEIQKAQTAKAENAVKEALNDTALDNVAGGADGGCSSTAEPGEWCWFSDSCSVVINSYADQGIPYDEDGLNEAYKKGGWDSQNDKTDWRIFTEGEKTPASCQDGWAVFGENF